MLWTLIAAVLGGITILGIRVFVPKPPMWVWGCVVACLFVGTLVLISPQASLRLGEVFEADSTLVNAKELQAWRTVIVKGDSGENLLQMLKANGIECDQVAGEILRDSIGESQDRHQMYELVKVTVGELGLGKSQKTFRRIAARAEALGLSVLPAEAVVELAVQIKSLVEGVPIRIAMAPVTIDRSPHDQLFELQPGRKLRIATTEIGRLHEFGDDASFVFGRKKYYVFYPEPWYAPSDRTSSEPWYAAETKKSGYSYAPVFPKSTLDAPEFPKTSVDAPEFTSLNYSLGGAI